MVRAALLPEQLRLHGRRRVCCLLGWALRKLRAPAEADASMAEAVICFDPLSGLIAEGRDT